MNKCLELGFFHHVLRIRVAHDNVLWVLRMRFGPLTSIHVYEGHQLWKPWNVGFEYDVQFLAAYTSNLLFSLCHLHASTIHVLLLSKLLTPPSWFSFISCIQFYSLLYQPHEFQERHRLPYYIPCTLMTITGGTTPIHQSWATLH